MYYKAISSGNADTLAIWETWDGAAWVAASVLPGASDDVYTNNNIVTVTTSQAYNSWNRSSVAAPLSITQGGQFQIDGENEITIQGIINGSNVVLAVDNPLSACVNRLITHTNSLHQIGDIIGGILTYCYGFFNNSLNNIDLTGDIKCGTGVANGFLNNAAATFTSIIGNQVGGNSGSASYGFLNNAAATFTSIIGNQIAGKAANGHGFYNNGVGSVFTSIIGNQIGSNLTTASGLYNDTTATFSSIVGNQIGVAGYGIRNIGTATFTSIIGNQVAGSVNAFYTTSINSDASFIGSAYASGVAAIYNTQTTTKIIYEGNLYNNLGVMAIWSPTLFLNVTPTTVWEFSDFGGNSQYLYGAGVNTGHPIESDVRENTVYGPNDEFEGTLAVPPPASVALNVPVDNTVGELVTATTPADFIAALKADDLGIRLGKCATTEEVDSTVAAYNS